MEQSSPICNASLPQFLIHRHFCYWFLLLLLYNLCNLGCGYLTHWVTWLIDHVTTWYTKKALSPPSLGQWPPILARCGLSWVDHSHRVTWLVYHVITLYSQKGASPVLQRQRPLSLVGLWVRVKESHLLFQVTCRSSDHVLLEKRNVSTNARL